jgi:hypothetical protein
MEEKIDIKPYVSKINALKLNNLLQLMDIYFSVHEVNITHRIYFTHLKLEGNALNWWKIIVIAQII